MTRETVTLRCRTSKLFKKSYSKFQRRNQEAAGLPLPTKENDTMPGKEPFAKIKLISQEWKAADAGGKISMWWK